MRPLVCVDCNSIGIGYNDSDSERHKGAESSAVCATVTVIGKAQRRWDKCGLCDSDRRSTKAQVSSAVCAWSIVIETVYDYNDRNTVTSEEVTAR